MKKGELRELYQMMFPEYPDIVTVKDLREMLGISRKLAYASRLSRSKKKDGRLLLPNTAYIS